MSANGAARISLAIGILVFLLKLLAWQLTKSVALYSDALESIVNIVGAFVAVIAVRIAAEPPDWNHPWGHAKAEYLSAVTEGVLVAVAAVAIIHEAWQRFFSPVPIESFGIGAGVSLLATVINGGLGLYLIRTGKRVRSPAISADGTHILTDVITTVGVLIGITVAKVTGWWVLDPIIAAILAVNITWAGWRILRDSIGGLMDEAIPPETQKQIGEAVEKTLHAEYRFTALRARRAGAHTFVELNLLVPGSMSVDESHEITNRIEEAVETVAPGANVVVHVEPIEGAPNGSTPADSRVLR
jgi:cation diffusion facilitator family transporter